MIEGSDRKLSLALAARFSSRAVDVGMHHQRPCTSALKIGMSSPVPGFRADNRAYTALNLGALTAAALGVHLGPIPAKQLDFRRKRRWKDVKSC